MDEEHLAALRQAAAALISTAAATTVLAALRALLADPEFGVDIAAPPLRPPKPAPESVVGKTPERPPPRQARDKPTAPSDPDWDALRGSVRRAMTTRGLDFASLGQAIGRSATAIRIDLTSRRPARETVQAKLKAWLANGTAGAPAVAAIGATFRRSSGGAYVDGSVYTDSLSAAD